MVKGNASIFSLTLLDFGLDDQGSLLDNSGTAVHPPDIGGRREIRLLDYGWERRVIARCFVKARARMWK